MTHVKVKLTLSHDKGETKFKLHQVKLNGFETSH